MQATISGAVKGVTSYQNFVPFTGIKNYQHFGLYILRGLSPSPMVEMNFRPQYCDEVHGNDFIHGSFGKNL